MKVEYHRTPLPSWAQKIRDTPEWVKIVAVFTPLAATAFACLYALAKVVQQV